MNERGFALAARTPPVQPTRRSALQSIDLAVRNAGSQAGQIEAESAMRRALAESLGSVTKGW